MTEWLSDQVTEWLSDWVTEWLSDRVTEWQEASQMIDRMVYLMIYILHIHKIQIQHSILSNYQSCNK